MKLKELHIYNFLTVKEAHLKLDDAGLVLIQGINNADSSATSNGSGKSSIADAISWCNYGVTVRGDSGDTVVNDVAGKDCSVSSYWFDEESGRHYSIQRFRKDVTLGNQVKVKDLMTGQDMTLGTNDQTDKLIEQIIGSSWNVFKASCYMGQEDLPDLPKMTDKALKAIVEEAAGTDVLSDALEKARDRRIAAHNAKVVCGRSMDAGARFCEDMATIIESHKRRHTDFEEERQSNLKTLAADARSAGDVLSGLLADPIENEDALKAKLVGLSDGGYGAALAEWANKDAASRDTLRMLVMQRTIIVTDLRALQMQHVETKKIVDNSIKLIGVPCKECGKEHTAADLGTVVKIKKDELLEIESKVKVLKGKYQENTDFMDRAQKAIDNLQTVKPQPVADAERSDLLNRIESVQSRKRRIDNEKGNLVWIGGQLHDWKNKVNPHDAAVVGSQHQLDKATKDWNECVEQFEALSQKVAVLDEVVEVLGAGGFRADMLDQATPYLNERTQHYLSTLSDGNIQAVWSTLSKTAKGELREKFNIAVSNTHGGKTFTLNSGGEKRKARLACAWALQDLVASRAAKPIDLFIGDEIDDALDPAGLERLMSILEVKARERGTVMVISHSDLTDWVDQVLVIEKNGKQSTVSGAACLT